MAKHTLVAERDLLLEIGGFDETFVTRELSDLFLRLNHVCSILGLTTCTYQLARERVPHASRHSRDLQEGLVRLVEKHRRALEARPRGHADVLLGHARMSLVAGPRREIVPSIAGAFRVAPRHTVSVLLNPVRMGKALVHLRTSG
jgi:hypothetical protein